MGLAANFPELKLPLLFALANIPLDENRSDRRKLQIEQFNCPTCFHNLATSPRFRRDMDRQAESARDPPLINTCNYQAKAIFRCGLPRKRDDLLTHRMSSLFRCDPSQQFTRVAPPRDKSDRTFLEGPHWPRIRNNRNNWN